MSAVKFDPESSYDLAPWDNSNFIFGYSSGVNSIDIEDNSQNKDSQSFSRVDKGYFKDLHNTGLQFFTQGFRFQTEEIEAYALV